jgi:Glycosyltransferase 61
MSVKFVGSQFGVLERLRIGRVVGRNPEHLEMADALCMPIGGALAPTLQLTGGLYNKAGEYLSISGTRTSGVSALGGDKEPLTGATRYLVGRSLYLGLTHYHYGHFLVETISRLWPYNSEDIRLFEHILLLPLNGHVPVFVTDFFALLGVADRVRVISEPTHLDRVSVAAPAVAYPGQVHKVLQNLCALLEGTYDVRTTDQPLFLSRTALTPGHHRVVVGESLIETAVKRQGFRIFYPEQSTLLEQLNALRNHRTIVGYAGSALHTMLLTGGRKTVFAYSARKVPAVFPLIDSALSNSATYIQAKRTMVSGLAHRATGFAPEIIDPRPVLSELMRMGLTSDAEVEGYGSVASDQSQARQYNTAVLLRQILELSQTHSKEHCDETIQKFAQEYPLDPSLIRQACLESVWLRPYFSDPALQQ